MLLALRHGTFRWLFAAQVASAFGNFAFTVAVAALLVEHGAGAGTIGTVLAVQAFGLVLFAVPAGVIADRFPRRLVCVAADLARIAGWPHDPERAERVAASLVADGLAVRADDGALSLPG